MTNTPPTPQLIRLPYRAPWDWQQFHEHFALRSLTGVECLSPRRYARSVRVGGDIGWFSVRPLEDSAELELDIHLAPQHAQPLAARVSKMFDLDSDPLQIAEHFQADPLLAPLLLQAPGLRLPTAFDPFEQAVRAIVGQQVTVKAAVTIVGRLVQRLGEAIPAIVKASQRGCSPPPRPWPKLTLPASACPASAWRHCSASPPPAPAARWNCT